MNKENSLRAKHHVELLQCKSLMDSVFPFLICCVFGMICLNALVSSTVHLFLFKVLKYWKPGFNDWFSFLLLILRHQESAIHRLGGFYYVHDPLNFYHRPYHDHNGVTCVHPNAYALFVASQTYVSGYNWDFVLHIVFLKKMM